jgi:glycosyltransferase involved in cell wall biosynthesis
MKKYMKNLLKDKKIKVKQIFGGHQIYQEIVNFPPRNVEYLKVSRETGEGKYYESKKLKEKLGAMLQKLKIPRMMIIKPGNYDLIHSSRGIIPLQFWNKKPWVIDMEHVHSFFGLNPHLIKNKFLKKFIERKLSSKYCKKILCHCEATRQAFFHFLDCEKFKDKIEVLYPSSHISTFKKDPHKNIRILAIMSIFYGKAGIQVLKVFSKIQKEYPNVEFWIRADVPKKLKKEAGLKNVKYMNYFGNIIPREDLIKSVYSKCDIFFYPTLVDSFGYSLIDAMTTKLPIVSTNLYAVPEIVQDKKNGLIVKIPGYDLRKEYSQSFPWDTVIGKTEEKFVDDCYNSLSKLIQNKQLRERMGASGFERISNGDLSISARNKKLRKTYGEAIA